MNISDEKLGAFLDQELSDQEMDLIRDAIVHDDALAGRLANLSQADALLKRHASALDARPMPDAVLAMLRAEQQSGESHAVASNVVTLSSWQGRRQQARQWLSQHAALAAGIALVIGFTGGQFISTSNEPAVTQIASTMDADVSTALNSTLSGTVVAVGDDSRLQSRFSFVDQQARHCRQFVLEHDAVNDSIIASENIACRTDQGWQLVASAQVASASSNEYQTASGNTLLDSALDTMMTGSTLSLDEENTLIANDWQ